jgi:hypothetical protein
VSQSRDGTAYWKLSHPDFFAAAEALLQDYISVFRSGEARLCRGFLRFVPSFFPLQEKAFV